MKNENLKNLENAIASIEAYKSHLKDEFDGALLCKISVQLEIIFEIIFKWEESLKKHLKDKYYEIEEREKTLWRNLEKWRNLELSKEHLNKMLVTTN